MLSLFLIAQQTRSHRGSLRAVGRGTTMGGVGLPLGEPEGTLGVLLAQEEVGQTIVRSVQLWPGRCSTPPWVEPVWTSRLPPFWGTLEHDRLSMNRGGGLPRSGWIPPSCTGPVIWHPPVCSGRPPLWCCLTSPSYAFHSALEQSGETSSELLWAPAGWCGGLSSEANTSFKLVSQCNIAFQKLSLA